MGEILIITHKKGLFMSNDFQVNRLEITLLNNARMHVLCFSNRPRDPLKV